MKKFFFFITLLLMIFVSQLNAAEWHTREATSYLLNKDYQLNLIILYCSEKYEDELMFERCVENHIMAYIDIYTAIEYLYTIDQDGFDISKPMKCLMYSLNTHWNSEYNTANWISVAKTASMCMDQ